MRRLYFVRNSGVNFSPCAPYGKRHSVYENLSGDSTTANRLPDRELSTSRSDQQALTAPTQIIRDLLWD